MREQYIAAIGGSAGVLDPLRIFFDHTPNDQVSYVILRHLNREHQSMLKPILEKHAKLGIIEVEDQMPLQSNKIYLLPSDSYMLIADGKFELVERNTAGPNRAVDVFLNSLAWDRGPFGIAVILSGAASDGTRGAQRVKQAGGLVIVQEPSSCEHASMPQSVIRSGYYDFIARPEDMPELIFNRMRQRMPAL